VTCFDVTDLYDKIKDGLAFRRAKTEEVGIGFEIAPIVPNVPKSASKEAVRIVMWEERMVGARGFEPPTPWSRTERQIH
jgi:hypothetical protein